MIISLAVVLAAAGGIGVWVFTGDYHPKGEDTTTDIAELNNGAEQETGSEKSQADTDESDSAEDRSTDRTDGTEDSGTSSGAAVTDGKTVDGTDQQEASGQTDAYDPSEGGIHRYEYVASDCSWSEAYQKCLDSGGYLARINSQEEYDYILSQIDQKQMQNIHSALAEDGMPIPRTITGSMIRILFMERKSIPETTGAADSGCPGNRVSATERSRRTVLIFSTIRKKADGYGMMCRMTSLQRCRNMLES